MVKATATCLHRVFRSKNHAEGNGRLPSPCVFGTRTMVKATAAYLHRVFLVRKPGEGNGRWPHCLFLSPEPW